MFNSFKHRLPEVSIFHHPASPQSAKALNLLKAAISKSYPPEKASSPPLQFDLQVIESIPTADQLRTIISYLPSRVSLAPSTTFISAHPSSPLPGERPETIAAIAELGQRNPNAIKWPIVVDWNSGKAAIGDIDGVKEILETMRKRRDGELKDEEVDQPKGWFT